MSSIALSRTPNQGHDMQRHAPYAATFLALFSVLMMGVGAEVESNAIRRVVSKYQATPANGNLVKSEQIQQASQEIEIIRDRFLIFIIAGGAVAGAAAYICVRIIYTPKDDPHIRKVLMAAFALSLLTSLFITPTVVKYTFKIIAPEECAAVSFILSAASTTLWDIINILGKRYRKAAEQGGIAGMRNEYLSVTNVSNATVVQKPETEK